MSDAKNESSAAAFQKTHPIGFNLFDDDDQQVIYIDDSPDEHNLNLEIRNTSRQSIDFVKKTPGDNHFELRFRPGTLLASALNKLALARVFVNGSAQDVNLWRINSAKQDDGSTSIYFSAVGAQSALTLAPDSGLKFTIKNVSADRSGGARGTRVELKYRFAYTGDATQTDGTRLQHLSIVNDIGKKNIPLHVGFVGSNTIVNDGRENERIIRITNLLRESDDKIPLSTVAAGDEASKFIFSFDVYEEAEKNTWALGKKDAVWKIRLDELDASGVPVAAPNWDINQPEGESQTPEWIIKPKANKTFLKPNESVQFRLSRINSVMRSGPANVYLRYENIPGYKDGQFITTLEKSSLVQRDRLNSNNEYQNESYIGIGTAMPLSALSISSVKKNDSIVDQKIGELTFVGFDRNVASASILAQSPGWDDVSHLIFKTSSGDKGAAERIRITSDGDVGIGVTLPAAKLEVAGNIRLNKYDLYFTDTNHGIGFYGTGKLFAEVNVNGPVVYGYGGGALGSITSEKKLALRWTEDGKVGIGQTDPKCALDILSDSCATGMLRLNNNNTSSGEVSIGFFDTNARDLNVAWVAGVGGWSNTGDFVIGNNTPNNGEKVKLLVEKSGKVGIGMTAPAGRLHISEATGTAAGADVGTIVIDHENSGGASSIVFRSKYNRSSDYGYIQYQDAETVGGSGESSRLIVGIENDSADHLILKPTGNVGISIDTPTAPLHVGNNRTMNHWIKDQYSYIAYTWHSSSGNEFRWGLSDKYGKLYDFPNVSICAEGRIVGWEFNALSDSRIKTNLSVSDPHDDLKLLKQFRVTDYRHKDYLTCGNPYVKGFIAQEVEQIFPQAVHKRSDFIPDIYTFAEKTTLDNDVLTVTMKKAHNLSAGETVRLVTQTEGVKDVRVETADEKTFSVRGWKADGSKMFVHGRKVDDFRTLDYQQIFSLGISGIQQLSKEVDELREANDALTKRLQLLESKLETAANGSVAKKAA